MNYYWEHMLTTKDISKLKELFVTKEEFKDLKDDILTKFDAIMHEIQAMREEMAIVVYRQSDHSDRIESLEEWRVKLAGKAG